MPDSDSTHQLRELDSGPRQRRGAIVDTDTVQATSGTYATNTVTISWVTPVNTITTTAALGKFFVGDGSCRFDTVPTATPPFILHAQAKHLQDYFKAKVPSMVITD